MTGGLAPSIVPDSAVVQIERTSERPAEANSFAPLQAALAAKSLPLGTLIETKSVKGAAGSSLLITAKGKAAHSGVNVAGGRNAIVAMASALVNELPEGGARDILAFAQLAGQDIWGSGLGLTQVDPVFGRATAVPTTLRMQPDGKVRLLINIRSNPVLSGDALKNHLIAEVAAFNARSGASLEAGGSFTSRPFVIDPQAKLVKHLLAAYERATGAPGEPAIVGGTTYAKAMPNAVAFGMWFPDKSYPGHDVDEQISVIDLRKGMRVLLAALSDLACNEPIKEPFKP